MANASADIVIDGGEKSGSGTIVRMAVALAALTGRSLRLYNIRARRAKPGLAHQHLTAIEAVREVCGGTLDGAMVGSREIVFRPGPDVRGGSYRWAIGTAGSTTMLALCLLPVTAYASGPCVCRVEGGLFQDFAPSFFHFQRVLLPALRRMGLSAEATMHRPGYVPRGGGVIEVRVEPVRAALRPLALAERRGRPRLRGVALASRLAERRVAERMAARCNDVLRGQGYAAEFDIVNDTSSPQPGAALALFAEYENGCVLGADQAGAPGRASEAIGEHVARALLEDIGTGATVDRHLADQLIVFAALADGVSEFVLPAVTDHVESNLWLVERFLGVRTELLGQRLRVTGAGYVRRQAHESLDPRADGS